MPLIKSKKESRIPDKVPEKVVSPRWENLKTFLAILLSAMFLTVAFGVYQIMKETSNQDLNSVKKRLAENPDKSDQAEVCEELRVLGYWIANCETMPLEDLKEIAACLGDIQRTDAKELAKRLGVDEKTFHNKTKRDLITKFLKGRKWKTGQNPDIAFTKKPRFLVFIEPVKKQDAVYTNVSMDSVIKIFGNDRL